MKACFLSITLRVDFVKLDCRWFIFIHLNKAQKRCLSVIFIIYRTVCAARNTSPMEKYRVYSYLFSLLWDNAAKKPSPKGCCCNQSLSCPSSNFMHRRNGSADRTSATLSVGKISASASYQSWQLTVAQWLDFSDNLLFVPPAHRHSCNLVPYMTGQRDVSWGELKSLLTYCTCVKYILIQGCFCAH